MSSCVQGWNGKTLRFSCRKRTLLTSTWYYYRGAGYLHSACLEARQFGSIRGENRHCER